MRDGVGYISADFWPSSATLRYINTIMERNLQWLEQLSSMPYIHMGTKNLVFERTCQIKEGMRFQPVVALSTIFF